MNAARADVVGGGLDRRTAGALQHVEYRRLVTLLRRLGPADWDAPTDCPEWRVRDVVAHLLGALEASASPVEEVRQLVRARRIDRPFVDALGVVQIRDRSGCTPDELVDRLEAAIARGVRGRTRIPRIVRAVPIAFGMPYGTERVTFGYLLDTILLRDAWMHRIDIARAVGVAPELTSDHDGVVVADVVREWARRHGQPFRLELDGPAGGRFAEGDGGEVLRLDAVEFYRIVAGRASGAGLLTQEVVF